MTIQSGVITGFAEYSQFSSLEEFNHHLEMWMLTRKNGSQTSNLYIFNRFPHFEPPKERKLDHHKETNILSKTKTSKNSKREESANQEMSVENQLDDSLFVSDRIPKPFVELVKCFFPSTKMIEEFWRMSKISAYKHNQEHDPETILSVSLDSFKQLIRKLKSSVSVKKPIAYYTGILNKKFQHLYFEELYELGFALS